MRHLENLNLNDPYNEEDWEHDPLLQGKKAIVLTANNTRDVKVHVIPIDVYDEIIEKYDSLTKMYFEVVRGDRESRRLFNIIMESPTLDAVQFHIY